MRNFVYSQGVSSVLLLPLGGALGGGYAYMCLVKLSIFLYDEHFPFLLKEEADGMSFALYFKNKIRNP